MDADGEVKLPVTVAPLNEAANVLACKVGIVAPTAPVPKQQDGVGLIDNV